MTLADLKDMTLKLLDDKPKKEITDRFNTFFNIGQLEIATTCGFIRKSLEINNETPQTVHDMPLDFFITETIYKEKFGNIFVQTDDYIWQTSKKLILNSIGKYKIEYKAYPNTISNDTKDDYIFDIPLEAQHALPFYVVAQICATDERDKYVSFLEQYQNKLTNLIELGKNKSKVNIDLRGAVYGI